MLNKDTLRTPASLRLRASLLPLRMALILAESASPARPRRLDADERLAMQLIARMQARYKKTPPFVMPRKAGPYER